MAKIFIPCFPELRLIFQHFPHIWHIVTSRRVVTPLWMNHWQKISSAIPESTTTLLIHFSTRRNTINCHKENLPRLYHPKQYLSEEYKHNTTLWFKKRTHYICKSPPINLAHYLYRELSPNLHSVTLAILQYVLKTNNQCWSNCNQSIC